MSDYDSRDLFDIDTYSNQTQIVLRWLYEVTDNVADAKEYPESIISLIGIFLNIFHLIILTQKSMRNTSINVLMIGIAFCDLFVMTHWTCCFVYLLMNSKHECAVPWSYFRTVADILLFSMKDSFRRVSALLGVLMAATRFLIIKNPLNPKYEFLKKPSFSWKIILFLVFLSTFFSLSDRFRVQIDEQPWTPPEHCTGFPENFTAIKYFAFILIEQETVWFEQMVMVIEGVLKIIPAILLPILAFLLVRKLNTASTARRKLTSSQITETPQKDRTTKLVTLMTVSFIIAEAPLGLVFMAQGFFASRIIPMIICNNFWAIFSILVALNATTHCLICMTMSSQYRNCAKSLFCGKSKPKTVIVSSKASVSSVTSIRNVNVVVTI